MIFEKLRWLNKTELSEPSVYHAISNIFGEGFDLFFVSGIFLNIPQDFFLSFNHVFLQHNSLGNFVASERFLFHLLEELDSFLLGINFSLPNEVLSPLADGVHELWLQKVIVLVKLEALMKK